MRKSHKKGSELAVFDLSTHFLQGNPMSSGNPMKANYAYDKAKAKARRRDSQAHKGKSSITNFKDEPMATETSETSESGKNRESRSWFGKIFGKK